MEIKYLRMPQILKAISNQLTNMKDVIIIGGGPAGMSAALYLRRSNKSVLILEKENFGGQIANSPKVENFPTHKEISGLELSDMMFNQISDLGVEFELEDVLNVVKVDNVFKVTTNYNVYESRAVIVANGVKHRLMGLPKEQEFIGNGISFCALCDGPMYKGRETFVIGDANTALQYALELSNYCSKVHLLTLFDRFFADKILVDRVNNKENIEVRHNLSLLEYEGEEKLEGLLFENTVDKSHVEYKTDNVFVCIGQIPNNDFLGELVELEKGYIVVDGKMETKTPGLFAAGDTTKKDIRQVISACADGATAGISADKYLG